MYRTSGQPQVKLRLLRIIDIFDNTTTGNIEEDITDKRRTPVNPTEGKHD
jgi:hypothetical protein